jgi:hypothetical protein
MLKKRIWANFQRIIELFTQNIFTKLSKIWVWDPGSEIRDPQHCYPLGTFPGYRIQPLITKRAFKNFLIYSVWWNTEIMHPKYVIKNI